MEYQIVADSSCDLNEDLKAKVDIALVPFKVDIDQYTFIDDENIDLSDMIGKMKESPNPIKTSCPGPGDFLNSYKEARDIFAVTISSKLSGTYNSAVLARDMALEEDKDKFIHVFDSKSASVGETLVALKIKELKDKGLENQRLIKEVEDYIKDMRTFFILESLDNLIKNGRISKTKGLIANVLNLKPIMGSNDGEIELVENLRGSKKAFNRLVEIIGETGSDFRDKTLGISHVNALEKAEDLKEKIEKLYNFKEVIIVSTRGLSSAYANDGGIILVY